MPAKRTQPTRHATKARAMRLFLSASPKSLLGANPALIRGLSKGLKPTPTERSAGSRTKGAPVKGAPTQRMAHTQPVQSHRPKIKPEGADWAKSPTFEPSHAFTLNLSIVRAHDKLAASRKKKALRETSESLAHLMAADGTVHL